MREGDENDKGTRMRGGYVGGREKKKKEKKISYVGGRRKKERGGISYGNKKVERNRMGKEDILGVVKKKNNKIIKYIKK